MLHSLSNKKRYSLSYPPTICREGRGAIKSRGRDYKKRQKWMPVNYGSQLKKPRCNLRPSGVTCDICFSHNAVPMYDIKMN